MSKLTKEEVAAALSGVEYRQEEERLRPLRDAMVENQLLAIFGYSDDIIYTYGYECEEYGMYDGGTLYLERYGVLRNDCDDNCPYFEKLVEECATVEAVWDNHNDALDENIPWQFKTTIPHAKFQVIDPDADVEDSGIFCVGIVIDLKDLNPVP